MPTPSTVPVSAKNGITWDCYYSKIGEWADSTRSQKIASLTDIGPADEVIEAIQCQGNEQSALKLCKKALGLGMRFTVKQLSEIECYLSEQGALFMVDSLDDVIGLNDSDQVCDAISEFDHEEAAFAMLKKAQRTGAKFTLSQIACVADYVTEDGAILMLHNLRNGLGSATQSDVCGIVKDAVYEAFCDELIQVAFNAGIRFDPANIIAMDGHVCSDVLNLMVDTCPMKFNRNQLLELRYSINDDVFYRAAKKSNIIFSGDE